MDIGALIVNLILAIATIIMAGATIIMASFTKQAVFESSKSIKKNSDIQND